MWHPFYSLITKDILGSKIEKDLEGIILPEPNIIKPSKVFCGLLEFSGVAKDFVIGVTFIQVLTRCQHICTKPQELLQCGMIFRFSIRCLLEFISLTFLT